MLTVEPKAACLKCEYIFEAKVSRRVSRDVDAKYDAVTTGSPEVVSVFRSESKLAAQFSKLWMVSWFASPVAMTGSLLSIKILTSSVFKEVARSRGSTQYWLQDEKEFGANKLWDFE